VGKLFIKVLRMIDEEMGVSETCVLRERGKEKLKNK
jgi:hypothetical protein